MKKLSKEFIEAMNGVLNGEKLRRNEGWENDCSPLFISERDGDIFCDEDETIDDFYSPSLEDMQATDWVKVED